MGKKNNIFTVIKKAYIETTIIFLSIFEKNKIFLKNLKKSAKYGQFSTLGECDGFLLVLKIPVRKFFVLLAQIPCFI